MYSLVGRSNQFYRNQQTNYMFFKKILALGITVERLTDVRKENRLLDYQKKQ